jgi:cell wall-associated NlpC family hydrolase
MTPENRAIALEHALKAMPMEACGVVIIERGHEVFVPCRNLSPIQNYFEIHPDDYAAAEDRGAVVRIVHSHCFASATPSEVDRVVCEQTKLPWSIVSVPNGTWFDFCPEGYQAPLVGRQWAHGVLDCYSLIRDYYSLTLGIEIPDFEREFEWWNKGQNLYVENFESAGFRQIPQKEIQKHDVIIMQIQSPVANHGAIYLGDDLMLHHLHRRLSCRDVFLGYYKRHTVKVLRHERI